MKKYAFAGASGRAFVMYAKPILGRYKDYATIVGMYDINGLRARSIAAELSPEIPVFDDFDEMLRVAKPDVVIVTTVDAFHHEYIIRSLEAGCEVVTEKPMTIDADKCEAILQAEKKYGKKVTVTFNYRYIPYNTPPVSWAISTAWTSSGRWTGTWTTAHTAPAISVAGTATWPRAAVCWFTSPPTISTWSTGGWVRIRSRSSPTAS